MSDRYQATIVVSVAVIKGDSVLLVKRKNTGYMDGFYTIPGGHLEHGETIKQAAARELKEETGVIVQLEDLQLFQVLQNEDDPEKAFIGFRFRATRWSGTPQVCEPDKSKGVGFFNATNWPKLSPYARLDIAALKAKSVVITRIGTGELSRT